MWSLYKKKPGEGIFDFSGDKLEPLKFSNGKTQADIVKEVLDAINSGNRIIFIKGVCGSGKSAIALNLAKHFKKTSIIVPIKSLQEQYEQDYTQKNFILKKDKSLLKISVIKGRQNFYCPFANCQADNPELPCTIEFREKNMEKLLKYIEQNEFTDKTDFSSLSEIRRMSVAPACPYWSPLLPEEVNVRPLKNRKKKSYPAVCGKKFALFHGKKGCKYYDQYESYINSDVLIFNSSKYLIETLIGRKPKTELDIIDECDEFLDNFANEKRINLNRLLFALSNLFPDTKEKKETIKRLIHKINTIIFDNKEEIQKLNQTQLFDIVTEILNNPYLAEDEESNYYNSVLESLKEFENLLNETYISFTKTKQENKEETLFVDLVTINLAGRLKKIVEANNILVLMSGTIHSEQVLKDIFGLDNFKIIEAETVPPGTISKFRTGLEKNCKYENFKSHKITREQYLKALNACVLNAKPPTLIHVNAFTDLPTELEKAEYKLEIISREKLLDIQSRDKNNTEIKKFKSGEIDILFTTKCSRGIDFPGEKCNSVVLTKYPYPNIKSLFWQILRREQPEKFTEFYLDKSKRELLQKIYRAIRFKEDHVILLSPDSRVLDANF